MAKSEEKDPKEPEAAASASRSAKSKKDEGDYITVKSGRKDNRVALSERHPAHPASEVEPDLHEVFVAGDREVLVGKSPLVMQKLGSGELVEVK